MKTLDCIVCEKQMKSLSDSDNHPQYGTEFGTRGHYGSRITDACGQVTFIVNICDDCVLEAIRKDLCYALVDRTEPPIKRMVRLPPSHFDHLDKGKVQ